MSGMQVSQELDVKPFLPDPGAARSALARAVAEQPTPGRACFEYGELATWEEEKDRTSALQNSRGEETERW
ncbi:hypothetical protein ACF06Q_29695 [Streptomyces leeuwenhoekii]|uniref:hypothetical protein n=1 Tax=Streptomyces leeuwenhoekii TaxID=1437453 RepID=UPI0036FDE1F8